LLECARDAALTLSSSWRHHLARTQAINAALVSTISMRTGKPLLVDSSKTGLRLKYLLRNKAFDVRVIYLVRDGRGVTLTHVDPSRFADAAAPEYQSGGTGARSSFPPLTTRQAARLWRRSNEEAITLLRQLDPARWVRIQYETLCEEPGRTLQNLFRFLGVEPIVRELDFRRQDHHVIGNGMRLDRGSDIRLDERWRSVMTSADLRAFDATAGSLNRSLGYF
jgi:hypothetical protein